MRLEVLTALLTFHTFLLFAIAIQLSAGFRGSDIFLQKCGESVLQAETYDVPETLREPPEKHDPEDMYKDSHSFPLLENSLRNCSVDLRALHLNTSVRESMFWTSTGYLVTSSWSYPPERLPYEKVRES